jgi:hypothetical protein
VSVVPSPNERLEELLAQRALDGLEDNEQRELEQLRAELRFSDDEAFDFVAAELMLAAVPPAPAMPAHVRARLERAADDFLRARHATVNGSSNAGANAGAAQDVVARLTPPARTHAPAEPARSEGGRVQFDRLESMREERQPGRRRSGLPAWSGWLAAAACLVVAVAALALRPGAPSLAEQRAQVLAASDVVTIPWKDWALNGADPEITGVQGEVVWSDSLQKGFMRFVGLPANDPRIQQYQLWIVDERGLVDETGQSARISGGVFDATGKEVIVPIEPRLFVRGARLFAVTIESPGGTWVSDMSRRVVAAAAPDRG